MTAPAPTPREAVSEADLARMADGWPLNADKANRIARELLRARRLLAAQEKVVQAARAWRDASTRRTNDAALSALYAVLRALDESNKAGGEPSESWKSGTTAWDRAYAVAAQHVGGEIIEPGLRRDIASAIHAGEAAAERRSEAANLALGERARKAEVVALHAHAEVERLTRERDEARGAWASGAGAPIPCAQPASRPGAWGEAALQLLPSLEWAATRYDAAGNARAGCPFCGGIDPDEPVAKSERGHKDGCQLAAILAARAGREAT